MGHIEEKGLVLVFLDELKGILGIPLGEEFLVGWHLNDRSVPNQWGWKGELVAGSEDSVVLDPAIERAGNIVTCWGAIVVVESMIKGLAFPT